MVWRHTTSKLGFVQWILASWEKDNCRQLSVLYTVYSYLWPQLVENSHKDAMKGDNFKLPGSWFQDDWFKATSLNVFPWIEIWQKKKTNLVCICRHCGHGLCVRSRILDVVQTWWRGWSWRGKSELERIIASRQRHGGTRVLITLWVQRISLSCFSFWFLCCEYPEEFPFLFYFFYILIIYKSWWHFVSHPIPFYTNFFCL